MTEVMTRGMLILAMLIAMVGFAVPAAADAPEAVPFSFTFDDVNPCGGPDHTVTISGTSWVHDHNGKIVVRSERTITTSSGFVGRGTDSFVANGQTVTEKLNDVLTHESGERIRAHFILVFDVSTSTVRAFSGTLTCVGG